MKELIPLFQNPEPEKIPFYEIDESWCDFFGAGIKVRGSLDKEESWPEGQFNLSRCFAFLVTDYDHPYYRAGDRVFATPLYVSGQALPTVFKIGLETPEECAQKVKAWLKNFSESTGGKVAETKSSSFS